jgi:hypothetical protein
MRGTERSIEAMPQITKPHGNEERLRAQVIGLLTAGEASVVSLNGTVQVFTELVATLRGYDAPEFLSQAIEEQAKALQEAADVWKHACEMGRLSLQEK